MWRVEFHCHTDRSKDSLCTPLALVETCRRKNIDRVVITDHNTIRGALAAIALDEERVIIGEEIMTTRGEILAAFVKEEVPAQLSPEETIELLRGQGAFISVSHPMDRYRAGGWREKDLLEIAPLVDAIEIYNSRCVRKSFNRNALSFANAHHLEGTVGSDAHTLFELGRSVVLLEPFDGPNELREVIHTAAYETHWSPPWIHFSSRYAVWRKRINPRLDMSERA